MTGGQGAHSHFPSSVSTLFSGHGSDGPRGSLAGTKQHLEQSSTQRRIAFDSILSYLRARTRNERNSYPAFQGPLASPGSDVDPPGIRPMDSRWPRICTRRSPLGRCPLDTRRHACLLRTEPLRSLNFFSFVNLRYPVIADSSRFERALARSPPDTVQAQRKKERKRRRKTRTTHRSTEAGMKNVLVFHCRFERTRHFFPPIDSFARNLGNVAGAEHCTLPLPLLKYHRCRE